MAKKKATPAKVDPPEAEPDYLSFLQAPKVATLTPTPTDFLQAPNVTIGSNRAGDPVRRKPGPFLSDAVHEVPEPIPAQTAAPFVAQPERKRAPTGARKRKLTEAQKRTKKIRAWMLTQFPRPDMETYRVAMDAARIAPTPSCLAAGKRSFKEGWQVPSLRQTISSEFSRLWFSREPKTKTPQ